MLYVTKLSPIETASHSNPSVAIPLLLRFMMLRAVVPFVAGPCTLQREWPHERAPHHNAMAQRYSADQNTPARVHSEPSKTTAWLVVNCALHSVGGCGIYKLAEEVQHCPHVCTSVVRIAQY